MNRSTDRRGFRDWVLLGQRFGVGMFRLGTRGTGCGQSPEIRIHDQTHPAFLVHTHDDASTSLGAVMIYAGVRQQKVPAELHIYENGGHGYVTRARPNSNIGTWPDRATDWLVRRGSGTLPPK